MEPVTQTLSNPANNSPTSRAPLQCQTNSPRESPANTLNKSIRRKMSNIYRVGSSEGLPTSHESIYDAECFSNFGSEDFSVTLDFPSGSKLSTASADGPNEGENVRPQPGSDCLGVTPILYGRGTQLETIVEQKSMTTISSFLPRMRSVSDNLMAKSSTSKLLGDRDSSFLVSSTALRRRKSFSTEDTSFVKGSYHDACKFIARVTRTVQVESVYAEPHTPLLPPLERPATPPGMPSWTAGQAARARVRRAVPRSWRVVPAANRFQRFFGIKPSPIEFPAHVPIPPELRSTAQVVAGPSGAAELAGLGTLPSTQTTATGSSTTATVTVTGRRPQIPPRFRAIRSGHGAGPLNSHPFLRVRDGGSSLKHETNFELVGIPYAASAPQPANMIATPAPRSISQAFRAIPARTSSVAPSPRKKPTQAPKVPCPHAKGRRHSVANIPDTFVAGANVQDSNTPGGHRRRHTLSGGPPADLTSAPLLAPGVDTSTIASATCWKCHASQLALRAEHGWKRASTCACWVFCGVDVRDAEAETRSVRPCASRQNSDNFGNAEALVTGVPEVAST
jgi:hypothetical protein